MFLKARGLSQHMSQFSSNLKKQRDTLGLTIEEVTAEMNRRGIEVVYSTVAGWFNGSRGKRWNVDELIALLDILKTDLETMTGREVEVVEGSPAKVELARRMNEMPENQVQALLALLAVTGK